MRSPLVALSCVVVPLAAQDDASFFRANAGVAAGRFHYRVDDRSLDDGADAGLLRLQVEGTGSRGFGGGVRFEGVASDDSLFARNGSEADYGSLYLHGTLRLSEHRFTFPVRFGLLLNQLHLDRSTANLETTYSSIGPQFELAPEVVLWRRRGLQWTAYGEFGVGITGTHTEFAGDSNDYWSASAFAGVEIGMRFRVRPVEIGLAYLGRWQSMGESSTEAGGFYAQGFDASFQGVFLTFGVMF